MVNRIAFFSCTAISNLDKVFRCVLTSKPINRRCVVTLVLIILISLTMVTMKVLMVSFVMSF